MLEIGQVRIQHISKNLIFFHQWLRTHVVRLLKAPSIYYLLNYFYAFLQPCFREVFVSVRDAVRARNEALIVSFLLNRSCWRGITFLLEWSGAFSLAFFYNPSKNNGTLFLDKTSNWQCAMQKTKNKVKRQNRHSVRIRSFYKMFPTHFMFWIFVSFFDFRIVTIANVEAQYYFYDWQ